MYAFRRGLTPTPQSTTYTDVKSKVRLHISANPAIYGLMASYRKEIANMVKLLAGEFDILHPKNTGQR